MFTFSGVKTLLKPLIFFGIALILGCSPVSTFKNDALFQVQSPETSILDSAEIGFSQIGWIGLDSVHYFENPKCDSCAVSSAPVQLFRFNRALENKLRSSFKLSNLISLEPGVGDNPETDSMTLKLVQQIRNAHEFSQSSLANRMPGKYVGTEDVSRKLRMSVSRLGVRHNCDILVIPLHGNYYVYPSSLKRGTVVQSWSLSIWNVQSGNLLGLIYDSQKNETGGGTNLDDDFITDFVQRIMQTSSGHIVFLKKDDSPRNKNGKNE